MAHKLALLGFGGVGQGFVNILREKKGELVKQGVDLEVVSISDVMKGSLHHPDGLNLDDVTRSISSSGTLERYPEQPGLIRHLSSFETIEQTTADTIVEMTYTDVRTGQPAIDHCKRAFEHHRNVVMTNKGPVALAYEELSQLACKKNVKWLFEGVVMSGTPAIRLPLATLIGNDIKEIKGILNGTTNYMLMRMEEGLSYDEALTEAKERGYAEANPEADVEGYDVLYKLLILANVVLGNPLKREEVERIGISALTRSDILEAKKEGKRWKLIGSIKQIEKGLKASVKPEKLSLTDPLTGISGSLNAITYCCDLSGDITLIGSGAGIKETGFAVLIDLIHLARNSE